MGIDAEAGATEILVIADAGADPLLVAADLISQAEHDELAAARARHRLRASSRDAVAAELDRARGRRRATPSACAAALAGPQSAIVLVDDLAAGAAFSNAYGPEHLEIQTADPSACSPRSTAPARSSSARTRR